MSFRGVDIRETGDRLLFRALLQDSAGAIVTSGTTSLRLYELQSDGTLKSYDFNDNTFKTGALTTETASMTHRTGNNSTTNTGIFTYALTTLSGFTAGNIYIAHVTNTGAAPAVQAREFQFGSGVLADAVLLNGNATAAAAAATFWATGVTTGAVNDASATTTSFVSNLSSSVTDNFALNAIVFTSGALTGLVRKISAYNGTTKAITLSAALPSAPANGVTFMILGRIE